MPDIEVSICVPTCDIVGPMLQDFVRSVNRTLSDDGVGREIIVVENSCPRQGVTDPINAALRAARGRYIVVSNDDVTPLHGWWPPFRAALDQGAAVARSYTVDPGKFGWWFFAMRRELVDHLSSEPGEFWDRRFKLWYSDTDFQRRLSDAGLQVVDVAESKIRHVESASHSLADQSVANQIAEDARRYGEKWSS